MNADAPQVRPVNTVKPANTNPLRLLGPERRYFWLGLIGSVVLAVSTPLLPLVVIAPLYNQVLVEGRFDQLLNIGLQTVVLAITSAVAMFSQDALFGLGASRFGERMRAAVFERLLAASPIGFGVPGSDLPEPQQAAGRVARAGLDVRELEWFYAQDLAIIASQGLVVISALLLLLIENLRFTFGLIVLMLVMFGVLGWLGRRIERVFRDTQDAAETGTARMSEGARKLEVVKAFLLESALLTRFGQANRVQAATSARRSRLLALQAPMSQLIAIVGLAALLAVALNEVAAGRMNPGQLTAYVVLLGLLVTPTQMVARALGRWAAMRESVRSLQEALSQLPEPDTGQRVMPESGVWRGHVRFEAVTARYPGAAEAVLHEISLELQPGEVVALVGPSGGGKTSVARLLLRFLKPQSGQVLLDGHGLGEYRLTSLRRQIALVTQQPGLFSGTIGDNLALARPEATEAKLWAALKAAGLADQVRAMPKQLETVLGEDGAGLSGGQAQRLAIARALLCQSRILILDEPTSALDPLSEALIHQMIENLRGQCTILVIAHTPATIERADRVVVLEGGKVTESGSPQKLAAMGGRYAALFAGAGHPKRLMSHGR